MAYTPTVIRLNPSSGDGSRPGAPSSSNQIAVFVDGAGVGDVQGETQWRTWSELGKQKSRTKENKPEVKKMAGTIIRQPGRAKRVASGPVNSKIVSYLDPPPGDKTMPPPCDPPSRTIGKTPQKQGKESRIGDGVGDLMSSFTPFRDGVRLVSPILDFSLGADLSFLMQPAQSGIASPGYANTHTPGPMKLKPVGKKALTMSMEAGLLRQNPLKNHPLASEMLDKSL